MLDVSDTFYIILHDQYNRVFVKFVLAKLTNRTNVRPGVVFVKIRFKNYSSRSL